jgi:hypothetical protein
MTVARMNATTEPMASHAEREKINTVPAPSPAMSSGPAQHRTARSATAAAPIAAVGVRVFTFGVPAVGGPCFLMPP